MIAYDYPLLGIFWTMMMFFIWIAWFGALFSVIGDIFRSDDMSGWAKAAWVVFVIVLPFLGVLIYVIVRGNSMQERQMARNASQAQAQQEYIQSVAGSGSSSTADQMSKLAELHKDGTLTDSEYQSQKDKLLA